jgi:hypothetical protein
VKIGAASELADHSFDDWLEMVNFGRFFTNVTSLPHITHEFLGQPFELIETGQPSRSM